MGHFKAGETVTLVLEDATVTAKIEDASKSETISAKVESSNADRYQTGQVYEFVRSSLKN